MAEAFVKIAGHEDYAVSDKGRVFSFVTKRYLKPQISKSPGYPQVRIGGRRKHSIHRLVALAFVPNPGNLPVVNHKNGIRHDNRAENLEWCSLSGNAVHAARVLGKSSTRWIGKFGAEHCCSKAYIAKSLDGSSTIFFPSGTDAARHGFTSSGISHCVAGRNKSHKGYTWEIAR